MIEVAVLTVLLLALSLAVRRLLRAPVEAMDRDEASARRHRGMPTAHPESLTRELGDDAESYLAWLSDATWPAEEWLNVIAEQRRDTT